ncbi:cupin domain-containing protein [Aliifodinibius sp. S!AR15-10]|uniref:cupin domain-containing protein n=1 Tax=Aliifodinibius sp. S!AR15-10 TaxID=2950437 RepID=UPI002863DC2F|nr:cupin domain-containing protein [Aliifodinibius sp. S!AR15-10]MDR8391365.1 cupin domain-containing protein [Aliifodinibius sp. S!AR15-10]
MTRFTPQYCTVAVLLLLFTAIQVQAQAQSREQNLDHQHVLTQKLSDPGLKDYKLSSITLEVAPGFTDTRAHRHNAELFGYVLQGRVEIKLEDRPLQTVEAGEMFYEPRNILHTILRNLDEENPAKILVMFIVKEGRSTFIPEYQ